MLSPPLRGLTVPRCNPYECSEKGPRKGSPLARTCEGQRAKLRQQHLVTVTPRAARVRVSVTFSPPPLLGLSEMPCLPGDTHTLPRATAGLEGPAVRGCAVIDDQTSLRGAS